MLDKAITSEQLSTLSECHDVVNVLKSKLVEIGLCHETTVPHDVMKMVLKLMCMPGENQDMDDEFHIRDLNSFFYYSCGVRHDMEKELDIATFNVCLAESNSRFLLDKSITYFTDIRQAKPTWVPNPAYVPKQAGE